LRRQGSPYINAACRCRCSRVDILSATSWRSGMVVTVSRSHCRQHRPTDSLSARCFAGSRKRSYLGGFEQAVAVAFPLLIATAASSSGYELHEVGCSSFLQVFLCATVPHVSRIAASFISSESLVQPTGGFGNGRGLCDCPDPQRNPQILASCTTSAREGCDPRQAHGGAGRAKSASRRLAARKKEQGRGQVTE